MLLRRAWRCHPHQTSRVHARRHDISGTLDEFCAHARFQIRELFALRGKHLYVPRRVHPEQLAVDAVAVMEEFRINQMLVVDADDRLVGALHIHDLTRAKVI